MHPHTALRFQGGHETAALFATAQDAHHHVAIQTLRDVMDALHAAYAPGQGAAHPLSALDAYERGDYRAVVDWHREYVAGSLEIDWLVQPAGPGRTLTAPEPLSPAALARLRAAYPCPHKEST